MIEAPAAAPGLAEPAAEAGAAFDAWVDREVVPHAGGWDRAERTPPEALAAFAATGWLGAAVPAALGGAGMDRVTFGLLNEALGRGCSSLRSLLTVHGMVSHTVARWGSAAQKARWLPPMAAGETIGAFALSEPEAGSDPASIRTEAVPEDGGYRLHGTKKWTTYGQIADLFLVFAKAEGKPVALLVERGSPGMEVRPLSVTGTRASMLAEVTFDGCAVPAANRVGGAGFGLAIALAALELGRYSVAWGCVGIVRACLEASLDYAAGRRQFGAPIAEHQLVQRMLADMATDLRAARGLCLHAGRLHDAGDPSAAMETFVAKYFASTAATRAALSAVQVHGANGCTDEYPVERYLRDSRVMEIIEGSTQIQQVTIARHVLERRAAER